MTAVPSSRRANLRTDAAPLARSPAIVREIRRDFEYARAAGMPMVACGPTPETLDIVEAHENTEHDPDPETRESPADLRGVPAGIHAS